jgi:hypothetical protein
VLVRRGDHGVQRVRVGVRVAEHRHQHGRTVRPSGDLDATLSGTWESATTMLVMLDSLSHVLPALLTFVAAAIFAAMLWAGSRVH